MLSLMTLNVRFGLADDGANGWAYRKRAFGELLKAYPADIIGLQEVNDFQAADISAMLDGYGCIGKRCPAPAFWQNNLVFHRHAWRCVARDHFFLSPTPTIASRYRDSRWPRQCTVGEFQRGDHGLVCVNTHLDFDPRVQARSAEAILQRLSRFPASTPVVLMGDFNCLPDSACRRVFTDRNRGAFRDVLSPPFPGTHHGFTGRSDGRCIDWILCRGRVIPETARAILDSFSGMYPSDHFPIHATFRFSSSPPGTP